MPSLAKITEIVRRVLRNGDVELTPATGFEDLPDWDSMHLMSLIVEVECRFDLWFEPHEIETLHTVGDLLQMTARKRALAQV